MSERAITGIESGDDKRLERYKKEYSEFIELAAHDLDAPLRKLGVLIERVLENSPEQPNQDRSTYVKRINKCLGDMRSLVDDLATLSRIIMHPANASEFELSSLIEDVKKELATTIKLKNVQVFYEKLPRIKADRMQFFQLFTNIIQNSLTFSRPDVPLFIKIEAGEVDEKEKSRWNLDDQLKYIKICISDNGIGFRNEYAEKIFRPFVKLNGKSEYEGNGIGLAISSRIIENHQGIIYAHGQENEGAHFIIIIPQTRH